MKEKASVLPNTVHPLRKPLAALLQVLEDLDQAQFFSLCPLNERCPDRVASPLSTWKPTETLANLASAEHRFVPTGDSATLGHREVHCCFLSGCVRRQCQTARGRHAAMFAAVPLTVSSHSVGIVVSRCVFSLERRQCVTWSVDVHPVSQVLEATRLETETLVL